MRLRRFPTNDLILDVVLPPTGAILEIATGTGEHVVHFPSLVLQPSNPGPDALLSVAACVKAARVANVDAPMALDAAQSVWPIASADGIIRISMSTFRLGRRPEDWSKGPPRYPLRHRRIDLSIRTLGLIGVCLRGSRRVETASWCAATGQRA
jgi:Protein of unknown function (DUF938)